MPTTKSGLKSRTVNGVKWILADYYVTEADAQHGKSHLLKVASRQVLIRKLSTSDVWYKRGWRYMLLWKVR